MRLSADIAGVRFHGRYVTQRTVRAGMGAPIGAMGTRDQRDGAYNVPWGVIGRCIANHIFIRLHVVLPEATFTRIVRRELLGCMEQRRPGSENRRRNRTKNH